MTQYRFLKHSGSHTIAIIGMTLLHTGLAAWAMQPVPPVIIPQQQVIQVSMVAPTVIKQEAVTEPVEEVKKKTADIPPKAEGMVKKEKPKQKPQKQVKREEKIERKEAQPAETQLTSGAQAEDASEKHAALTEPVAAAYFKNPPPEYPHAARKKRQQGTVMLRIMVTIEGHPAEVNIAQSSGHELLDKAAVNAVKKWKFLPARRGNTPVEASVVVPIRFKIT